MEKEKKYNSEKRLAKKRIGRRKVRDELKKPWKEKTMYRVK